MNWLGLIAGILVVGFITWGWRRAKNKKDLGGRSLPMFGFTLVGYNINQMDAVKAERLAIRLEKIKNRAWPELCRIYGEKTRFGLESICFDTEFSKDATHNGVHFIREVIELVAGGGSGRITMRPAGGGDHPGEYWFSLELHNWYRFLTFGADKVYLSDYHPTPEEELQWDKAQDACKGAVP